MTSFVPGRVAASEKQTEATAARHGWLSGEGLGWKWEVPAGRWTRFWFPLVALAVGILVADHILGSSVRLWSFLVLYHSPFGMYTGMPFARGMGFSPVFLTLLILHLHVFGGLFLVWNIDWLKALPWLGPKIERLELKGRAHWQARPRLRHLGVLGLGVFVLIPVTGTGLITGCILGRFAGLPWFPTLVAVVIAGMIRIVALILIVYQGWAILGFG